jgi:hypothetical protein
MAKPDVWLYAASNASGSVGRNTGRSGGINDGYAIEDRKVNGRREGIRTVL